MIKPTVGRVVWFWEHGATQKAAGEQPRQASIAYVHSDRCVNIGYLDCNGVACSRTSVDLIQDGEQHPEHGFCEWMPYQTGQARAQTPDLENLFTYHKPFGNQPERYEIIRNLGRKLAEQLVESVPDCDERRKALGFIRAAVMWANAGIACNEKPPEVAKF